MSERAFDNFTKRAKQVLQIATEEARAFNHPYIGTEHILLGLIREGEGVAARVLDDLGVKLSQARHAVEFIVGMGEGPTRQDQDLTARAKKVIAYAVEEAKRLNHHYIGTEHFLLGLVRNGEGVAVGVLDIMGVSLEQVRTQVMRVLRQGTGSGIERASSATPVQQQSKTPYLDALCTDLTESFGNGQLDSISGRMNETESLMRILSQRFHNNPILVGEPGVGKTSIVHRLAQRIVTNDVPDIFKGKRIVALNIGTLSDGIKYKGQIEERLKRLLQDVEESHAILFIDNLHSFFSASDHADLISLGKILQQALSTNAIQIIGETYPLEYRSFIAPNSVLQTCIQPILISSPTLDDVRRILSGLKASLEHYHQLQISDEAINAAVVFADYVRPDLSLLEKGKKLIDEAAAHVKMYRSTTPLDEAAAHAKMYRSTTPSLLRDALRGLEALRKEREAAIEDQQMEQAADLLVIEERMLARIAKIENETVSERPYVTEEDITSVINDWQNDEIFNSDIAPMSGEQAKQLHAALLSAFPTFGSLEQMVRFELSQNLNTIASSDNLAQRVWELIRWSEANGKVLALIQGASRQNPDNPEMRLFLGKYAASDKTGEDSTHETGAGDVLPS